MSGKDGDYRVIDLAAAKSEADWGKAWQAGIERTTEAWFSWLGWILATGAIAYLAKATDDPWLKTFEAISLLMLWMYFTSFFASLRIEPWTTRWVSSATRSSKVFLVIMLVIVGAIPMLGIRILINHVVRILQVTPT